MPTDIKDMLRRLADLYETEEKADLTRAQEDRIAKLEASLARSSQDELEDAVEEITEDELEIIRQHRASLVKGSGSSDEPVKKEKKVALERRVRPGRKSGKAYGWTVDQTGQVQKVDIATIYNGPDEPEEVELDDEPSDDEAA